MLCITARRIDRTSAPEIKLSRAFSPNNNGCQHVDLVNVQPSQRTVADILVRPAEVRRQHHRNITAAIGHKDVTRRGKLCAAAARDRVVERNDEIASASSMDPPLDLVPWRQEVGQRNGAEIMSENGTGACRRALKR